MRRITGAIVAALAALCLAAAPTDLFDAWLSSTVQYLTYHIPLQHVWIVVDQAQWEARKVQAADTQDRERAIRRAVCFAIRDIEADRWEWDPAKTTYEVYALTGGGKTVLIAGVVLNCTVEEATDIWHKTVPSHPARHHYF